MNSQERVRTAISLEEPDRVPMHEAVWQATVDRWHKEGLPEAAGPDEYFDFDFAGIGADLSPGFEVKVLSEDDKYIVETTK